MDSVGHYARPELLSLAINDRAASTTFAMPAADTVSIVNPRSNHHEYTTAHPVEAAVEDEVAVLRVAAG
jgi:nitrilase